MPREVIAFFHETREKDDEVDGDDEDEGDSKDEVVTVSKQPVVNPYASKLKEKQVAKVFYGWWLVWETRRHQRRRVGVGVKVEKATV